MKLNINQLIYNTLGLNKGVFIFRVYGLAAMWALTLIVMRYFVLRDTGELTSIPSNEDISAILFFFLIDAPITETLIFQGFIQGLLRHATGSPSFSIIVSALIFSLVHLQNSIFNATSVIALGLALALTYEYVRMRGGNIYALIFVCAAHIFWNVLALLGYLSLPNLLGVQ